ncbi:hypothetical protein AUK04_04875 [Candidatus Roizmanbacteria bacterium CG2_30_33_16]|uniref:Uncharacterized protein n=1 Tax=Candidatus Roizmanbacteria bacterium CG2_30_33_16 TaxID=1805340 RepID=A0A1J5HTP7_9BACT|nr:MAG: hypothetical protein AUK04_04875 [Candidatus Roizmanbacteria bacterium CG2_30_33_16]
MKKKQSKFKIIVIFFIIIILIGLIFLVNNMLQEKPGQAVTTIKKTKAAAKTYSRLLALNNPLPTIAPTNVPTVEVSPTEILLVNNNSGFIGAQSQDGQLTPTISDGIDITNGQDIPTIDPTAELLARNNITVTISSSISPTSSIIPTKTEELPETGWIQYSLILFASATTLFLLAFIF